MPSAITEKIGEGQSFEDFIMRALQGYWGMDKPIGEHIPLSLSSYFRYKEALNEFKRMTAWTHAEREVAHADFLTEERSRVDEHNLKNEALSKAYQAMETECLLFQVPDDARRFIGYCQKVLGASARTDCVPIYYNPERNVRSWYEEKLEELRKMVQYHLEQYMAAVEQNHEQNTLLTVVREALERRSKAIEARLEKEVDEVLSDRQPDSS